MLEMTGAMPLLANLITIMILLATWSGIILKCCSAKKKKPEQEYSVRGEEIILTNMSTDVYNDAGGANAYEIRNNPTEQEEIYEDPVK